MNLNGITDSEVIRIELLNRARLAGHRQMQVTGIELIAAVTGMHPAAVPPTPQADENRISVDMRDGAKVIELDPGDRPEIVESPPVVNNQKKNAPPKSERKKTSRSRRSRNSKKK